MKKSICLILVLLFTALLIPASVFAEDGDVPLALISFENMDEKNEHDYLAGLISAVLREDLSKTDGLVLLDRRRMNNLLEEQKLQLSGFFEESDAVEAGKMLGSDYLAGGNFVVIGTEVLLDVTLIDVETSEFFSFSTRGDTEDLIHSAAEKIVRKLTGEMVLFRTADSAVPILRQELLPPGTLKFFSPFVRGKIYLDDEFYGYTSGDSIIPIEIELLPGVHTLETDYGREFGVVIEPEILFEHWRKEFRIVSGKSIVLEDPTKHYNTLTSQIRYLLNERQTFYFPDTEEYSNEWSFSFLDREGQPVEGSLTIHMFPGDDESVTAEALILYNNERNVYNLVCPKGGKKELEEIIGVVQFEFDLSGRYPGRCEASWSLYRIDVYHNMYME